MHTCQLTFYFALLFFYLKKNKHAACFWACYNIDTDVYVDSERNRKLISDVLCSLESLQELTKLVKAFKSRMVVFK